jgi:membrane associated rhomboid family serine protease
LHQLFRDPFRVLFGSAFWVSSTGELLFSLLAFSLVATAVERWIGTARTAAVFFFGHVGATLLVAFWLWASLNFTIVKSPTTTARDVGSSYGLAALAALLTYQAPSPRRWFYAGSIVLLISITLILDPSFTNWGHLFAFTIGFLSYRFLPRKVRRREIPKSFFAP